MLTEELPRVMGASWLIENWYWPALVAGLIFAYGIYENRRREKLRRNLNDAGVAGMLGDRPGAGGALDSYADAELPIPAPKKPSAD